MTKKISKWIDTYRTPLVGLAFVRIFYSLTALTFGVANFTWISDSPPAFFHPPISIALLWSDFPEYLTLQLISTLVCVLYILLLFGYKTRHASVALTVLLVIGYSFYYSFDKIDHNIMTVVFPAVMAFSGWEKKISIDARQLKSEQKRTETDVSASPNADLTCGPPWPIALMALFIGFGYFSAGVGKLSWIDLDPTTHGARSWLLRGYFVYGRQDLLAPLFVALDEPFVWEAMDLLAVSFEVGFLIAVLHVRWFKFFVATAVFFHLANYLMLNISFASMIRIYGVYLPWVSIAWWLGENWWSKIVSWQPKMEWLILAVMTYVPLFWFSQGVIHEALPTLSLGSVSPLKAVAAYWSARGYDDLESAIMFFIGFSGVIISLCISVRKNMVSERKIETQRIK